MAQPGCKIPNGTAAASYSRYSSELQDEASIASQQLKCRETAEREGHVIEKEYEFSDEAISGTKLHRAGLDALLAAAKAGQFRVLYFFSLSRLARESIIAMPLLKTLVYNCKVRVISITEGVDSDREGWAMMATVFSLQHEQYIKELSANTLRGQQGNIRASFSNGDYCFGYASEPDAGSTETRRGRHARARMVYVIDQLTSSWVLRMFHWFVVERRSIRWIARELNRLGAPKDHRATTKVWHHQSVARLLSNCKYIGSWPWGAKKNVRNPLDGTLSREDRPAHETEAWLRRFPHLQIIDDETFEQAQKLLEENRLRRASGRSSDGRFNAKQRGSSASGPRHLLASLIKCANCGRRFHVGGAHGKYLFCPGYASGQCTCQTRLLRSLAEALILAPISERICSNPAWLQRVQEQAAQAWRHRQQTMPGELQAAEAALATTSTRIKKLLDTLEGPGNQDPDILQRLAERRAARIEQERRRDRLLLANVQVPPEPTNEWIEGRIHDLASTLHSGGPAAAHALRALVGGEVVVEEIRRPGRKRYFLRGTFTIRQAGMLTALGVDGVSNLMQVEASVETITLDFLPPNPRDEQCEEVKALWDQDLLGREIAEKLGLSKSQVSSLLKHWKKKHGIEFASGHARRARINRNSSKRRRYELISEAVMQLYERGVLLQDIAQQLKCDRNTVTAALKFAHTQRKLTYLDGRSRRKQLLRKTSQQDDGPPLLEAGS